MTSSYNDTPDNPQPRISSQNPLFQDPEVGDKFVSGSRVWIWDGEKWNLQHLVVTGDETIKQGPPGESGKSAYETWLDLGNVGTEQDFIDSLKGEQGEQGVQGDEGQAGTGGGQGGTGGQGPPGPEGPPGDAICAETDAPPTSGPRGKLWIDSLNQIYVTLKG